MEYREYRAESVGVDDEGAIRGLVTPFDRETVIGDLKRGGFREEVSKGTFTKTLREGDPLMIWQHNMAQPLARASAGNLELREGTYEGHKGLVINANPVDTSYAQDMRKLAKAKVLGGFSFGFNVVKDDWYDDDGNPSDRFSGTRRVLREVQLIEVSPVTRPAYGGTILHARDESSALLEERAAAVSTADRKSLAKKGHALPDGSYPIPDIAHLHAAAILAASHHGDWQAAKELIRKRAPQLGVDVNSLPGFGDKDGDSDDRCESCGSEECPVRLAEEYGESRDDPDGKEYAAIDEALRALRKTPPNVKAAIAVLKANQSQRDDPDGQEYACIDHALRLLQENPPDVKGAISMLHGNQKYGRTGNSDSYTMGRSSQEPDASTPDPEDDDLALRMTMRSREIELELL